MSIFDDALSHVRAARRELEFAIGAIEMAKNDTIALTQGYTGALATKEIHQAIRVVKKAEERLEALNPKKAVVR